MKIDNAPVLAMRNKSQLSTASRAGCYHCLKMFDPKEIKEYTDQKETALCPYCSVDAVIAENLNDTLTEEYLKAAKHFWIGDYSSLGSMPPSAEDG